jgi:hypothetical protein
VNAYRYASGRRASNPLGAVLVLLFFAFVGVFFGARIYDGYQEREDMTRALEFRAKHGTAVVNYRTAKPGTRAASDAERTIRDASAAHNAILAQHPTWTLAPLDTLALTHPAGK